ncbi:MAG: replicative helicase [Acidimicrobiia bacterium]|nr:replicative helicase [Acidimicrobiia bacterium]
MARNDQAVPLTRPGGRLLPSNLQAEESLLGAMLLSRDAIAAAAEIVQPHHFYKPAHGHVYDAVLGLYGSGEPVDPITVSDELARDGLLEIVGGPGALVALQANAPAISNAARYARIIEELALLRKMIAVAGEIAELGYSMPDDVLKAVDSAEALVFDLAQHRQAGTTATIRQLLEQSLDRLEQLYERGEAITGTPTGYLDLDDLLAGLQPNALVVIGARPAMGKTSFALGMATHAALVGQRPVLFFSLEMSQVEITQRVLCSEARVDATRVRNGRLNEGDWEKISHTVGRLAEAPIWIDDNPNLTVMEIRSKARKLKSQIGDLGLVVVDYIQLMTGRSAAESRQVEVAEISRGLKILAREIETPVVALAQLNRGLEQRADKRPMLSDLRESGCLPANTRIMRADNGEEVTIGELMRSQEQPLVWSVDANHRLVAARLVRTFPSGVKPVFRLRLASGRTIEATANHPFLTPAGWTRLDLLEPKSLVAVPACIPEPVEAADGWSDEQLLQLADRLRGDLRAGWHEPRQLGGAALPRSGLRRGDSVLFAVMSGRTRPSPSRLCRGDSVLSAVMSGRTRPSGRSASMEAWGAAIPQSIFGLADEKIRLFVQRLGVTQGPLVTPSARLALDVQRLLLRLGVRSSVSSEDEECRDGPGQGEWHRVEARWAGREAALGDIDWDPVVEMVPVGHQPTFDATIAGTHNFLANGIVVHNSLEQDADVVMFLYRDEIYNRESPDQGIAEVIVAKHRSGPTGMVRLAFLGQYTKFVNMART